MINHIKLFIKETFLIEFKIYRRRKGGRWHFIYNNTSLPISKMKWIQSKSLKKDDWILKTESYPVLHKK